MEFKKVKSRYMYEDVVEQLKEIISKRNLKPGDRLPSVRSLSNSFNVGQSTVREALSILKTMGLIETRQGEGTFISHFDYSIFDQSIPDYLLISKEDIIELLEVRMLLERGAAGLAAQRRTQDDLKKIETTIKDMEADLTSDTVGEEADWLFHFAVAEASHNKIIISLMEQLSTPIKKALKASRSRMYTTPGMSEKLLREHDEVFLSIKNQDVEQAEIQMVEHLKGVLENVERSSMDELK